MSILFKELPLAFACFCFFASFACAQSKIDADIGECEKPSLLFVPVKNQEGFDIPERIQEFVAVTSLVNPQPLFIKKGYNGNDNNVPLYSPINAVIYRDVCMKDSEKIYNYFAENKAKHSFLVYMRPNDNFIYKTEDIIISDGYSLEEICSFEFHSYPEDKGKPCSWHDGLK